MQETSKRRTAIVNICGRHQIRQILLLELYYASRDTENTSTSKKVKNCVHYANKFVTYKKNQCNKINTNLNLRGYRTRFNRGLEGIREI